MIEFTFSVGGKRVTVRIEDDAAAPPPPVLPPELTDKELAILRAATDEPTDRKRLILRAGQRYNSHSRAVVAALVARGLLAEDGNAVRRPPDTAAT